jgi:hypothetical protein
MQNYTSSELKQQWQKYFKSDPPARAGHDFMLGHLMWTKQAVEHKGLKRKVMSQIKQLMCQLRNGSDFTADSNLVIKSGTRLIRQYKEEKHEVIVIDNGFLYRGTKFTSLSAIARHITGTQWNGKVFFGVKK